MLTKKIKILSLALAALLCLQIPVGAWSGSSEASAPLSYTKEELAQVPKETWDKIDVALEELHEHNAYINEERAKLAQKMLEDEYMDAEMELRNQDTDIYNFTEDPATIAERELQNSIRKTKRKKAIKACVITISTLVSLGIVGTIVALCVKNHKNK